MKILLTVLDIMDIGGIGPDLLWKIKGMERAGHSVDLIMLRKNDEEPKMRGRTTQAGATEGPNGLQIHPRAGFFGLPIVSYGSKARIRKLHRRFAKYDIVIHEIPGPNPVLTLDVEGYWKELYNHDVPQIISAHDANFRDMYPHLIMIADKLKGISCTNQAGYRALEWFPAPRAFIGAPHPVYKWENQPDWDERSAQGVSAHVWKRWKNMHTIVQAIPRLKDSNMILCGDGIERYYMTSKTKVKPLYQGIWAKGLKAGMDFRGMLSNPSLHKIYKQSRVLVDMSWSEKFINLGCHFNRSIIEGYNNGLVPIVVTQNMLEEGFQLKMFKNGRTHFEIANTATPRELAQLIDHVANLDKTAADAIVKRGRKILTTHFDYRKTSLEYIKLAQGKPAGVYPELETGKLNKRIRLNADKYMLKLDRQVAKRAAKAAQEDE